MRDDASANTLAIAAAALIPLMALIGGGVDVSRAYMAKSQLQSACDAGVLAGRKALSKSGSYGTTEKAKATSMFNFNFNANGLDVRDVSYVTDDNDDGQVLGTATAILPTLVMKIFDKDTVELTVDCMAELQIGNADIMFVLDTTGSMAGTRISGLRDAVRDFHKTLNEAVNDNETRIRYGFVPYSMTINAHDLVASGTLPTEYLVDVAPYQSRLAVFDTPVLVGDTDTLSDIEQTYSSEIEEDDCYDYGDNDYPSNGNNPVRSGTAPNPVTSTEYDYVEWERTRRLGSGRNRYWIGWCTRRVWTTVTTYTTEYQFTKWRYQQVDLDTATAKALGTVTYASSVTSSSRVQTRGAYDPIRLAQMSAAGTATNIGTSNSTWNGCIEARDTVDDLEWDPIPDGAHDLDLSTTPDSDSNRWKPYWGDMMFSRTSFTSEDSTTNRSHLSESCPSPMMEFRTVELDDDPEDVPDWLNSYVNALQPRGNTYHDIGMIWGGLLSNTQGVFADSVNDGDLQNVSRHLIFMSDGQMEPNISGYNAYGLEYLDNRIAPRNSDTATVTARHNARFLAVCEAIKAQGITVWVVAFGTTLSSNMQSCASEGRAYQSNDTTALRNTFKFIAAQVADLRLGA